jgi:hypothetical protein
MKMLKAAGILAVLALAAFPGAALAHTGKATLSCAGVQFDYALFPAGSNTVHYKIVVDNGAPQTGDFVLNQAGGTSGSLSVPLNLGGTHTVAAYTWWGPAGVVAGHTGGSQTQPAAYGTGTCDTPAPPATTPSGGSAPTSTSTPAAATVPAVAAPAPAQGVQGVKVSSPARTAVLGARTSCASRVVRVTVRGQQMRSVAFSVNGRHVRTVSVRSGQRSVRAALAMRNRRASQVVSATVRFRNGAAARTLSARASRCAQVAVQPQFTG